MARAVDSADQKKGGPGFEHSFELKVAEDGSAKCECLIEGGSFRFQATEDVVDCRSCGRRVEVPTHLYRLMEWTERIKEG